MDVRDVYAWAELARRKGLVRRIEAANAALLPHQETKVVRQEMESLRAQLMDIDRVDEIEATDKENVRRMAEANAKLRRRQREMRAKRAAGTLSRKKYKVPAKAKVLK
jgi:hypothetical protein